jgi:hypothetical protein
VDGRQARDGGARMTAQIAQLTQTEVLVVLFLALAFIAGVLTAAWISDGEIQHLTAQRDEARRGEWDGEL